MIDSNETVLKFIQTSDFRKAPNPARYNYKGYIAKTKSTIRVEFNDLLRLSAKFIYRSII